MALNSDAPESFSLLDRLMGKLGYEKSSKDKDKVISDLSSRNNRLAEQLTNVETHFHKCAHSTLPALHTLRDSLIENEFDKKDILMLQGATSHLIEHARLFESIEDSKTFNRWLRREIYPNTTSSKPNSDYGYEINVIPN